MILVDLIKKDEEKYTYFYLVKNKFKIREFVGGEDAFMQYMDKIKMTIIISLFEDFRNKLNEVLPHNETLYSIAEARRKISSYITWALKNSHQPKEVYKFAEKSVKRANIILDEVPEGEHKNFMIFLMRCVTFNVNHRII